MLKIQKKQIPGVLIISSLTTLAILLISLGEILWIKPSQLKVSVSDITAVVINLGASFALLAAAIRTFPYSKRLGIIWGVFFIAQLHYAVGDIIWSVIEIRAGTTPFPSLADGFYIAYYPLMMIGILLLPYSRSDRLKKFLDGGIVVIASLLVYYNFLIGPMLDPNTTSLDLSTILSLAYPVCDLLLLWSLMVLVYTYRDCRQGLSLAILGISALLMIVSDTIFTYQSLSGTYTSGGFLDFLWNSVYILAGLAGIFQAYFRGGLPGKTVLTQHSRFVDKLVALLPYLWVIASFTLLVHSHFSDLPMGFTIIAAGVGTIISLVIIRQLITLVENRKLNANLNQALDTVRAQATDLKAINDDLSKQINERKQVEEKLAHHALYDSLTGLPNRVLFMDRLNHAVEYAKRHPDYFLSVLFLDLDHFKVINDSLGHTVGDELLIEVAKRLTACVRTSDTIGRLGGDEFVILLEDTDGEVPAIENAERIKEALHTPYRLRDHDVVTTTSIGIVTRLDGESDPDEILRNADIAMYRAKILGKAQYVIFTDELLSQAIIRLQMENELRHALELNELKVYYQPIYSTRLEKIIGFEALVRWDHPRKGIIRSGEFIPIAEESGLILNIGEWVLKEACSQMYQWNKQFHQQELIINVNISSKQFSQPNFASRVKKILNESGLNPECLRLEITERVVIENLALANEIFSNLKESGIRTQIDDFGTGYSSLSYLQHFPIQGIKIDMSFIQEMDKPGKNYDLVHTILMMAKDLGMEAIAEGVETSRQLEILKDLSCEFVQGFYLAEPMDARSVEKLLLK